MTRWIYSRFAHSFRCLFWRNRMMLLMSACGAETANCKIRFHGQCSAYFRWIHYTCENSTISESFSRPGVIYYCVLCSRFFNVSTFTFENCTVFPILSSGLVDDVQYYIPCEQLGKYCTVAKHLNNKNFLTN